MCWYNVFRFNMTYKVDWALKPSYLLFFFSHWFPFVFIFVFIFSSLFVFRFHFQSFDLFITPFLTRAYSYCFCLILRARGGPCDILSLSDTIHHLHKKGWTELFDSCISLKSMSSLICHRTQSWLFLRLSTHYICLNKCQLRLWRRSRRRRGGYEAKAACVPTHASNCTAPRRLHDNCFQKQHEHVRCLHYNKTWTARGHV